MSKTVRMEKRQLKALSRAIEHLYQPGPVAGFPEKIVRTLESLFGSELAIYNEFPRDQTPFVHTNTGFEKGNDLVERWAPFMMQNPLIAKLFKLKSITAQRLSDEMPIAEFHRTHIYNEFYRPIDGDYQMGAGFPAGDGMHIGLALNQKSRDFTDEEVTLFKLIAPHAQQAYQICQALEAARAEVRAMASALDSQGSGVLSFDDAHRVVTLSALAAKFASMIFHCRPREGAILPEKLRDCVKRLSIGMNDEPPAPRRPLTYLLEDGSSVVLRLSSDPERLRHCLIFEREPGAPDAEELAPLGLTHRETEVVVWMLQGKTSWEIGTILGVSSRTIEKHVENIFVKLGINDRRQLQGRIRELCAQRR